MQKSRSHGSEFAQRVVRIVRSIPEGKVLTYGAVATAAGKIGGARTVAWILHSSAEKENLPWHRIVNREGRISLKPGYGYELQRELLEHEGVVFQKDDRINLRDFHFNKTEE